MKIDITPDDINSQKVIKPGTYLFLVEKSQTKPSSKGDGSSVEHVTFKGLEGDAEGVPVMTFFSEKVKAFSIPYFQAFGADFTDGQGGTYDFANCVGKQLKLYIKNEERDNRMTNVVAGYMRADA